MPTYLKLTEEIAASITARVKSLDFKAAEKIRRAGDKNGTFDVIISTEVVDRAGEIVRQSGWDLTNYKNNPIVLWGHDYYSLPIGICTETYVTEYNGVPALGARGVFYPADINPLAQQVRRMYEYGLKTGYNVGCTTSVGFIPREYEPDNRSIITRAELLEFSFVPVPANQGVGPAAGRAITFEEARELGLDITAMRVKGLEFADIRGAIPANASKDFAPAETAWTKLTLADFTDRKWEDLDDAEKIRIAGHFAYATETLPADFADLKLPYRSPSDGKIVLNGLKAAMGALTSERGGVPAGDRKAVYEHLASYYALFGQSAPEFKTLKAADVGDRCTTDDGKPGVLAADVNDPEGPLVCQPDTDDKTVTDANGAQKALVNAVTDEQERHLNEIEDAIESFREKALADGESDEKGETPTVADRIREAAKDLRSALADEHTMHRAKSIAAFRAFSPFADKAFDNKAHLKSLREAHDVYEAKNNITIDEFEERCLKAAPEALEAQIDGIVELIERNQRAHRKTVVKLARAMGKDAFGEEEQVDEKTLEILKEHLAPFVPEQIQRAVFMKVGARISAATKQQLSEAHQHLKAATAIVEELHGAVENDDGEEDRSDTDKTVTTVPRKQRSRPTEDIRKTGELDAHLLARDILRGITTAAQDGLATLKQQARK